jgi:aminoglycoside 6'-N-acetyltransferase
MAEPTRELTGDRVVLEPLREDHYAALRAIHEQPGVRKFWGEPDDDFPADEPTSPRWAIVVEGETAGLIQYWEEPEPESRHAGIDILVDSGRHNQGIGTDAVRTLVEHLFSDLGHHRIVIDPEVRNTAAIRCYEKVGFEPIGVERKSFFIQGEWRDCLLMDLIRV